MKKEKLTTQSWIEIERIFDNGIIKINEKKYLKIIKVNPINFNLKSNLEKEAILNSYKIFLKTCDFDIQILIQSCKENLENNVNKIKENLKKENKNYLTEIANEYFNFIQNFKSDKNLSNKRFFIIISNKTENQNEEIYEDNVFQELNEKYFKIKECLARCGNLVQDIDNRKDVKNLLKEFLNIRKN